MSLVTTRVEALERLMKYYRVYYDVTPCEQEEEALKACCAFHVHNEKYVLTRKAQLWSTDCNEYVYIFSVPHLTKEGFFKYRDRAYELGMKEIKPESGHMYSYITAVFLCDSCDKDAERALKRCRIYKSFRLGIYGWMNYQTGMFETEHAEIVSNRMGREIRKLLKNVLDVHTKR